MDPVATTNGGVNGLEGNSIPEEDLILLISGEFDDGKMIRRYSVEPSTSIGGPLYSGSFLVSWDISVVRFSVISRTGRLVGEVFTWKIFTHA